LAAPLEEVAQACSPAGSLEDVVLCDRDHRQPAAFGAQRVPRPAGFLLPGQQRLACDQPLVSRCDLRESHGDLLLTDVNVPCGADREGPSPICRSGRLEKDKSQTTPSTSPGLR